MRCPEVVVDAVNDVVGAARRIGKLDGRIDKPFRFFEPVKGEDSKAYPQIDLITTSVQRENANYFGRMIRSIFEGIPKEHLDIAKRGNEAALLVIGSNPYMRQIQKHLIAEGLLTETEKDQTTEREKGLRILKQNPNSNLGWRIVLEEEDTRVAKACVIGANENSIPLVEAVPGELRAAILDEANTLPELPVDAPTSAEVPPIRLTSYESAKGLAAQYVVLVGVHENDLPRNAQNVQDLEICKFLVGLTRTRKKCSVLITRRFASQFKNPSVFLSWVKTQRFGRVDVNAAYFDR
jgi:hypothetical protein